MQNSDYKIYNASAGSGKTFTLAKEYLKILIRSKNYDQFKYILAITFTNKAVGEMKERILEMLKSFSDEQNLANPHPMFEAICEELSIQPEILYSKSKHILKHIIHNYGAFDISTIDGFTHRVIRTFAHDLKLPVNFEVELDQERLLNEAVDSLIAKAGSDKTLTKILVDFAIEKADDDKSWDISYDFNKISKLLVNENDLKEIEKLKGKTLQDFNTLKEQLLKQISETEQAIKSLASSTLKLIEEAGLENSDFSGGKNAYLPNYFLKLQQLNLDINFSAAWIINLENKPLYPQTSTTDEIKQILDALQPEIITAFNTSQDFVFKIKFLKSAYKNITPLSVLNAIQNELNSLKEEQNKMLISEFNKIISNEIKDQPTPFIYERLGEKFKHYFIDEFQDTSKMQWENLVPLLDSALSATNGSTMLVGDAKQAIYRWRGGEAEQFIHLYNKTENPFQIEADVLSLETNYRSAKEIILFNNSFFEFLSEQHFNDSNYAELFGKAKQKTYSESDGYVDLNFLDIKKDEDSAELYVSKVLETINQCLRDGFSLDDICVLVRKRKEGVAVANHLNENGVNITSSETLLLKNSKKIIFIDSFLKLLLQPNNDSLKVKFLSFIAEQHQIEDKHHFFSSYLKKNIDDMFDGLKPLNIFINKDELLQLPLYELLEQIIRVFNLNKNSDAYLQFYMDVVLEFTQKQNSDLGAFIDYFGKKKDKLSVVSPSHTNAVKIMTIHKAKGLEFPVVIFPFADLNIYKELEPKIWFPVKKEDFSGFDTLLLNYGKDIEHFGDVGSDLYQKHQSKLELDNINLLYVVLTRAIDQLYVISKKDISNKGLVNEKTYAGLLISFLQQQGKWLDNQLRYSFGVQKTYKHILKAEEYLEPLNLISVPKEDHNLSIITKAGLLWDTQQEIAIERGNLVHLVLSKIRTRQDFDFAFNDLLVSGDITKDNIDDLKNLVLKVIEHPQLNIYFEDSFTIYNERDIITSSGQLLRPDRININSKNEAVILDYKTGDSESYHNAQLKDYEAVLNQMNLKVTNKILVYINDTIEVIKV
ncbi:UvrD-helicase domain-containing protein [uncultured Winogradskyella sp.]|uniref:UvrD-helicase domain-containing protein n=1 Tax=uncultured Winogradskyella sp. TaxID=395353 RepID=UPI00261DF9DC|nr:UvrD-helicase domain-containing protein [uncultured Winogradskyella sp.]